MHDSAFVAAKTIVVKVTKMMYEDHTIMTLAQQLLEILETLLQHLAPWA